jgi:hypothetical protein
MFAITWRDGDKTQIRVLDSKYKVFSGDIINDFKTGKFLHTFIYPEHFIEKIAFDRKKKFLVGWG